MYVAEEVRSTMEAGSKGVNQGVFAVGPINMEISRNARDLSNKTVYKRKIRLIVFRQANHHGSQE
jgi:hypothetical protein